MNDLERALYEKFGPPHEQSRLGRIMRKHGVAASAEFKRVRDLPRYTEPLTTEQVELVNRWLRAEGSTATLNEPQARLIVQAYNQGGALMLGGVGYGKSFVLPILPVALSWAKRPLAIVPANLKHTLNKNVIPKVSKLFKVADKLRVVSANELGLLSNASLLWQLRPDLIIIDEAHNFKNKGSGRTRRVERYLKEHPGTMVIAMSGTITSKSIKDYHHILHWCLPLGAPLPVTYKETQQWSQALDADVPEPQRLEPGALLLFCNEGEHVREGYRRRLTETPGVIATTGDSLGTSLTVTGRQLGLPSQITSALKTLRDTWCTPGGEEIMEVTDFWRHARSLALGFWNRWVWPNDTVNDEWMRARSEWGSQVRHTIRYNRQGIDTELAVVNAADRGLLDKAVTDALDAWRAVKDQYDPVTEAVWLHDWAMHDARRWGEEKPGIIWFENRAVAQALHNFGIPVYAPGYLHGKKHDIEKETGKRTIAASINSYSEGKNLQMFNRNLVLGCPASGKYWEQLLGRTHRQGQLADEVTCEVYQHTRELRESFDNAQRRALYAEQTTSNRQKLIYASVIDAGGFFTEQESAA